jgi:hypothetical protein
LQKSKTNNGESIVIDADLIKVYLAAKYIVVIKEQEHRLQLGAPSTEIDTLLANENIDDAYFITPENPFSLQLNDEENKLRHIRFLITLDADDNIYFTGYGTDEHEKWGRERSYLILNADKKAMHQRAASFDQNGLLKYSLGLGAELLLMKSTSYDSAPLY